MNTPQIAKSYSLGVIKQALAVCFHAKRAAVLWGGVGIGKSSIARQLSKELEIPLWDFRVSDKESTDIGGMPFPITNPDGTTRLIYLPNGLLPFVGTLLPDGSRIDEDYNAILFFDEIDRNSDPNVQGVMLQLLLDREINGHKLPPGVVIMAAGNGASDQGTMQLTDAAATRLVHFYVETQSAEALDSWLGWAQEEQISPALQAFAKYRQSIFCGKPSNFVELQEPNPRTMQWADELAWTCQALPFGHKVLEPLVYGTIGQVAGREMIAFYRLYQACPTAEQIVANPKMAAIPTGPDAFGLIFALGQHLIQHNTREGAEDDPAATSAYAVYAARWPEEQTAHFFKSASKTLVSIIQTPEYRAWERTARL